MKNFLLILSVIYISGCANRYPTNKIQVKTTFVPEEKPDKYDHPPEDLSSVVGHDGYYYHGYSRYY